MKHTTLKLFFGLLAISLVILVFISQKATAFKPDTELKLTGEYTIVGVSRADNITWKEFDSLGYFNNKGTQFIFIDELRLNVENEISQQLLDGHREFNYHFLNEKQLLLVSLNSDNTYTFNYQRNGSGIDLSWDHPHFVGLQLMPIEDQVKTTGQNLPKY